ncbi:hypothetical protein SESBI_08972 [Sesbania bispinosa]|nr:hypothetical protein SESBI_08972 [Sesbania bispinosa]
MLILLPTPFLVEAAAFRSQEEANCPLPPAVNVTTVAALVTPTMFAIRNKETMFRSANIAYDTTIPWMYATLNLDIHRVTQNIRADLAFQTKLELPEVAPLSTTSQVKRDKSYMEKDIMMGHLQYPVPTSHRPNSNN